jgi:hypothetical protein
VLASKDAWGIVKMAASEFVAAYRLHSAQCTEIAQRSQDPEIKLALLTLAQSWLALAEQAIKNSETVLVYETPGPGPHVAQQPQSNQAVDKD